jgi:hypothetical protein
MPQGKGTYGKKVGRPKKKTTAKKAAKKRVMKPALGSPKRKPMSPQQKKNNKLIGKYTKSA